MTNITVDLNVLNTEIIVALARDNVIDLNNIPENILHKTAGKNGFSLFDIVENENIFIEKRISLLRHALMNDESIPVKLRRMYVVTTIYTDKNYERTNDRDEKIKQLKNKWSKLLTLISVLNLEASASIAIKIREALHADLEYVNKTTKGNSKEYINFIDTGMPAFCKPQRDELESYDIISQRTYDTRVIAFHKATNWLHYNTPDNSWFVREAARQAGILEHNQIVLDRSLKLRKAAAEKFGFEYKEL